MNDTSTAEAYALRLRDAERAGGSVPLPSVEFPGLTWADARSIARARDALRVLDGDSRIGFKLGWTSATMRDALGIDRPNWGTLWRSQVVDRTLSMHTLRHAKLEPELVYVAGQKLEGSDVDRSRVDEQGAGWALGLEVVHPRFASFEFTWLDNTADNSSASRIAVGPVSSLESDPAELEVVFDGHTEQRRGRGSAAMGSPSSAVAWLVRNLAEENLRLSEGDIVFTGGLTSPFDMRPGETYSASSSHLGSVELSTVSDAA